MIQFTHIADDNPDLALSPLLWGARLTLDYIEANGRPCQKDCTASDVRSRWLECGHASPSQTR